MFLPVFQILDSVVYGRWVKYRVLVGVIFLNLCGGFSLYYGNLYAYSESYYRFRLASDRLDIDPTWVLSICLTTLPIGSLMADAIKARAGLWCTVLLGVVLQGSGFLLGYLSVMNSVWATAVTYGAIGMFGLGIIEVLSYSYTATWFPNQKGIAGSMVGAASSIGSIFYNSITTAYINPNNLKPDLVEGERAYFTQSEVLDRVPDVFLILGVLTIATQVTGLLMVKAPDSPPPETERILKRIQNEKDNMKLASRFSISSSDISYTSSSNETANSDKDVDFNEKINSQDGSTEQGMESPRLIQTDIGGDMSPKRVLRSVNFYLLWHSLMALALAMLVVSNYYKAFGQVWIHNDTFLTVVGNISAISGTAMRVLMGVCIDRLRIKSVILGTLCTTALCLVFWYFTAIFNRWLYLVITNLLIGLTGSVFVLYPLASMKFFGLTYFATNTGLVMLAMTVIELTSSHLVTVVLSDLGWFWLFFIISAFMTSSFLATAFLMSRTQVLR